MSRFFRVLWFSGGLLAVALGTLGMFLPLLPTVPFLLLAIFCFAKSSPTWAAKILHHPFIGKPLREWLQYKGIRKKDKIFSIAFLWISILVSIILVAAFWVRILLLVVAIAVTIHLLSFKTIK
ncbi:MAG: YbaN family protein [Dysgonamonadaceae bacterium]|jgi:uncharacterized membrane protein YbaN (DUF454 family)|nr:YbaN family protein [Dysgonamonadaceae bacterium]